MGIKVVFMSREYPPYVYGGAGVHVEYLTKALQKLLEVEVRSFGDQQEMQEGIRVKGYQPWSQLGKADSQFQKVLQPFSVDLAMVSDPINADLIHAHTWYSFMAGFLGRKLYNLPLVTTIHSLEPLRPWKREQLGRGYLLSSWMEKTGLESSDRIIAVSRGMKEDLLNNFSVAEEKVRVIYNGIDLKQYQETGGTKYREKYGIKLDQPYVLFVGRITRQKGIIHLVNALEDIDSGAQIVLCAGAPDTEEIKKEMEEKVSQIQSKREGVIWINEMVSREAVVEFYSRAAVFVCPSVYEPFGIINLEAMACRTPVVASAVGGIKEVVVDGETGFLVDYENQPGSGEPADPAAFSHALAEKINIILADHKLGERMAAQGRKRVEEHFSWEIIARQTAELYQELLE